MNDTDRQIIQNIMVFMGRAYRSPQENVAWEVCMKWLEATVAPEKADGP